MLTNKNININIYQVQIPPGRWSIAKGLYPDMNFKIYIITKIVKYHILKISEQKFANSFPILSSLIEIFIFNSCICSILCGVHSGASFIFISVE